MIQKGQTYKTHTGHEVKIERHVDCLRQLADGSYVNRSLCPVSQDYIDKYPWTGIVQVNEGTWFRGYWTDSGEWYGNNGRWNLCGLVRKKERQMGVNSGNKLWRNKTVGGLNYEICKINPGGTMLGVVQNKSDERWFSVTWLADGSGILGAPNLIPDPWIVDNPTITDWSQLERKDGQPFMRHTLAKTDTGWTYWLNGMHKVYCHRDGTAYDGFSGGASLVLAPVPKEDIYKPWTRQDVEGKNIWVRHRATGQSITLNRVSNSRANSYSWTELVAMFTLLDGVTPAGKLVR